MAPQFGYWSIQGLGQACRMILHYTDTEYEDTVWEVTKREVWMDAKSKNDVSLDFPNLPYWIDGNVKLTQSSAILRHLARKNGLYGLTDANADEIDMLVDTAMDLKLGLIKAVMGNFDNGREEVIATADAKFLQLSNYLGCKKFLMGNASTVADFALYDALKWHNALDGHLVSKYGNIVEYIDRFENLPRIKAFLKSPKFQQPFFPPFAKWGNGIDNPTTFKCRQVENQGA